ncbi:MAG: hypothetical protein EOO61_13340 [Hymenobacter sp.]|nr:MAG: hypothetical protein EOO61_13340 [Hymenobacter sp.]
MKKPSHSLPPGLRRQADAFVQGGGEIAAEKNEKPTTGKKMRDPDKSVVAYTLRIFTGKLEELATIREARLAEQPDRTISVHSLLLEAVDEFLKNEAKRANKKASKKTSKT